MDEHRVTVRPEIGREQQGHSEAEDEAATQKQGDAASDGHRDRLSDGDRSARIAP